MAATLLAYEVSDLCIGKPALRSLSVSATVGDALNALKICEEIYLTVWSCDHAAKAETGFGDCSCRCVGKICMVDILCFLCRKENVSDPATALELPVSEIFPSSKEAGIVRHVEAHSSLIDAIDLILEGAQNLVVPINITRNPRKKLVNNNALCSTLHNGREYCCVTQEDIIRFLLNLIGLFSPLPALSIEQLGIISTDILAVGYYDPALSAVDTISKALLRQTSIAVLDEEGNLIGELSPFTLACCDETIAGAIATLSAGELMSYIDCGGPSEDMIQVVKGRLREQKLDGMLDLLEDFPHFPLSSSSSMSSEEEFSLSPEPTMPSITRSNSSTRRSSCYSARMVRRAESIVCHPRSSLVAVMIQALAHRVNYVWVIEEDYSLAGIVTFSDMLKVFREHLQAKK